MNPLIELNKHPLPAEQVEKLVSPVCSKCAQPIEIAREINHPTGWIHSARGDWDSILAKRCSGRATPAAKAATEATNFARKYVHEQRLPAWVVEHIANAYSFGEMEGIKRGRAE